MFIEDIFVKFYKVMLPVYTPSMMPISDFDVCFSFYESIVDSKALTQNQRLYVISLLERYKGLSAKLGFNYKDHLLNPMWKNKVRVIDTTRKLWVEEEDNITWICARFPYQIKERFDDIVERSYTGRSIWDPERKIRKLSIYNTNLFALTEFAEQYGFEQDNSYSDVFAKYEDIVLNADDIIPYATMINDNIVLVNCADNVEEYYNEHKTDSIDLNLLLLKSMAIPYKPNAVTTSIDKIAIADSNKFWINDIDKFIDICYATEGQIGIVIDRASGIDRLLESLKQAILSSGHSIDDMKVCIKQGKHLYKTLNKWLYDNKSGTNKSKFLIFLQKPSKWIFKDNIEFAILGTNALYPSTSIITKSWINQHPCVMYITEIKPSSEIGQSIVEL